MKLGRNLARTFLDYYKLQNLIIFNPTTAITPKNVNYIKTSNTSQNLSSFNANTTTPANATNPNNITANNTNQVTNNNGSSSASTSKDSSSSIAAPVNNNNNNNKPVSTSRMSKNINQTLKPLSSLSLAGHNSSSSLNNGKDENSSSGKAVTPQSATSTDSTAATTGVTFSLG